MKERQSWDTSRTAARSTPPSRAAPAAGYVWRIGSVAKVDDGRHVIDLGRPHGDHRDTVRSR